MRSGHAARSVRRRRVAWWRRRIALMTIMLGAGCGGADTDQAAEEQKSEQRAPTTGTSEVAAADLATFCEKELALEVSFKDYPDVESLPEEEQAEEIKAFYRSIQPLEDEVEAVAPAELDDEIRVLRASVDEAAATGDESLSETPEWEQALRSAHSFVLENCGRNRVDVTATDYAFSGVPETLESGPVNFELVNQGGEVHEMLIFRKDDGVTESVEELLASPEGQDRLTFVGSDFAESGEEPGFAYVITDLQPGEYVMACFLPVGSTNEAVEVAEESGRELEGEPHANRGMTAEFVVE